MDLSVGSDHQQQKTSEYAARHRKQKGWYVVVHEAVAASGAIRGEQAAGSKRGNMLIVAAGSFALWGYAWAFQPARTTICKRNPIAQSSLRHT